LRLSRPFGPGRLAVGTILLTAAFLVSCAADKRRVELCSTIAGEVLEAAAGPYEARQSWGEADLLTLLPPAGSSQPEVACLFDRGGLRGEELTLRSVSIGGRALDPLKVAVFRMWLHLPVPDSQTASTALWMPPVGPAGAAAYFSQQVINALVLGTLLSLIALGYTLVYGITETIQFAYGEMLRIGGCITVLVCIVLGGLGPAYLPLVLVLAAVTAAAATSVVGFLSDRWVYRPIRDRGRQAALIVGVGLSIFLQNAMMLTQGKRGLYLPLIGAGRVELFEGEGFLVSISVIQLGILAMGGLLCGVLTWIVGRTSFGRRYRACADDRQMADLLGIDTAGTIGMTMAAGAGLAALSGTIVSLYYGQADFSMGFQFGFKALTAALLGGLGSVPGALIGSLVIACVDVFWSAYVSLAYKDLVVFVILVMAFCLKPEGLWSSR
jgi:branched-chain amino acid transport system permease protein